jgi:hypothetical protein
MMVSQFKAWKFSLLVPVPIDRPCQHLILNILVGTGRLLFLVMHRILILPDIKPAGYPAKPKAGYRISGRISGKGRIPDIRPDTWVDKHIFGKISNKFVKTITDFCKHQMKHDLETKLIFVQIFFSCPI